MFREEKTFILRFSLEAEFPLDYDGEADDLRWLGEWEGSIKPLLLKSIFTTLHQQPGWTAHIRNRGLSALDEIEVAMVKDVAP
jgi:hypothetical protein